MRRLRGILLVAAAVLPFTVAVLSVFVTAGASHFSEAGVLREVELHQGVLDLRSAENPSFAPWWAAHRGEWLGRLYLQDPPDPPDPVYHREFLLLAVDRYPTPVRNHPSYKNGFAFPIAHQFRVRLWPIAALALAVLGFRLLSQRRRAADGHCPACGYDLRATPERCPECGRDVN